MTRTREVRSGFLGLFRRTEHFTTTKTVTEADDFWVLERRYWRRKETGLGSAADETTRSTFLYCLRTDGSLFVRTETEEEVWPKKQRPFVNSDVTERPMEERDVLLFDFAARYYESTGQISVDTDADPDKSRPKHHAKGVGLSLALTRLRQGKG